MRAQDRLVGADFLRAMACLLVLAHHLALRLDMRRIPDELAPTANVLRFGNFGVAIFFVLSGFLLARPFWHALDAGGAMPSLGHYAIRRLARITPGFWFAASVGFILSLTLLALPLTPELVVRYVSGLLFMSQWHWRTFFPVEADGPLWSIPFEVTSYVLLPAAFFLLFRLPLLRRRPFFARAVWLCVIAVVLLAHLVILRLFALDDIGRGWAYGLQGGAKEWMPNYNPIGFFAVFALGAFAAGIEVMLSARRSSWFDAAALLALSVAAYRLLISPGGSAEGYGWLDIPYGFPVFPLAVATALVSLSRAQGLGRLLDNAPVRYVAKISFGIYIWQEIILTLIQRLDPGSFGASSENVVTGWLQSCTLTAALVFLVASLSYYLLERPVIDFGNHLTSRRLIGLLL
ncbi:acyltransferase [Rhizobium bangladeshense]|nr:acyltransferase [Rhizobium bangladeshense]MBX5214969.1 acyltransferase [Rhizobium sp. NLR9a]MBX5232134.1 acyltransferase [Rhizobium sp. NLR4a]MBX5244385.1 acyltransferase [Rhizobium sp. NLR3b]MBX5249749.1 acyltransferase [Rhizobium sp. NLR4b]MBX5256324.1 acyltransferase [Rhizobium sp. NLR16b]MBX5262416.1 acyltransferase [Rhizobium sp. NLR16a]MBX5268056.1 acyltransferase [Rhizobium sp. NLR17b]MBX5276210.1 acyltransferase [Rhizobium sp. NLR13a]MBX5281950.1 acyltransferase [Rhizobium sp. N